MRGRGYDYDDPRAGLDREAEIRGRRQREAELHSGASEMTRGGVASLQGVSPLQGTKVVIQNLQTSVTVEDIEELFGDIGALKKAKVCKEQSIKAQWFLFLISDDQPWPCRGGVC